MNQNPSGNRRRRFRLRLPHAAMLNASIGGQSYDVIEVAEFSFCVTARDVTNVQGQCTGRINWSDGSESEFTGVVGDLINLGRLIVNVRGINTKDIVNETRRVIVRFPRWDC